MKILYLMSIDWYWIKQRPQFLALELADNHEVDVWYLKEVFKKIQLQSNTEKSVNCSAVCAIPFRDKMRLFENLQRIFFRKAFKKIEKYDVIWISYPTLYKYIPSSYKGKIIYDCMDYHVAMCGDKKIKKTIVYDEKKLVKRADLIFVSSQFLMKHIADLEKKNKVVLIRNGYEAREIKEPQYLERERYKICYIGTLAEWFDITLIEKSLERLENIEYHFLGPKVVKLPENEKIIYDGIREHRELFEYSKDMDCLIMPFQVNEIIEAVDPVKLYEYISMGKCIVSVYYDEIERFEPYVYFYHSHEEYVALLMELQRKEFKPKYSVEEQREFLEKSSWNKRGMVIKQELEIISEN